VLEKAGIAVIGAGLDLDRARLPFDQRISFGPESQLAKTDRMRVFAAFAVYHKYRYKFHAYAAHSVPGTNPLKLRDLAKTIADTKASDPKCFVIAILHWRRDYKWRSRKQVSAARRLLRAGADLIIGHGSHMMQEVEKVKGRWVVHGLGNFVFNSPGRYEKMGAPPYSLIARLIFDATGGRQLRLYPIMTDNRRNSYQTRFVTDAEFDTVYHLLLGRSSQAEVFEREIKPGKDEFAAYLAIPI
jgi:poly-gamma-glutamate capsule biosynthesis protein CapA/YwtB (metallophosphatase superfamily)